MGSEQATVRVGGVSRNSTRGVRFALRTSEAVPQAGTLGHRQHRPHQRPDFRGAQVHLTHGHGTPVTPDKEAVSAVRQRLPPASGVEHPSGAPHAAGPAIAPPALAAGPRSGRKPLTLTRTT